MFLRTATGLQIFAETKMSQSNNSRSKQATGTAVQVDDSKAPEAIIASYCFTMTTKTEKVLSSKEKEEVAVDGQEEVTETEQEDDDADIFDGCCMAPRYQPILSCGDDEEDGDRVMMGYSAYHGNSFLPPEVKDNVEHFLANNQLPSFLQKFVGKVVLGREE